MTEEKYCLIRKKKGIFRKGYEVVFFDGKVYSLKYPINGFSLDERIKESDKLYRALEAIVGRRHSDGGIISGFD